MKKLRLTVELEYDDSSWHGNDDDSVSWFRDCILMQNIDNSGELLLHSNEVGDTVGEVKVLTIVDVE